MQKTNSGNILQPPSASKSFIYSVCFITNILVNFDHGIVPAASKEIKQDLKITDFELGILGSVVYAGLLLGSVAASQAFMMIKTKKLIIGVIVSYIFSLLLFLVSDRIILLGFSRTLVGFFQVFLVVFFPVWVDLHGGSKQTLWLTILQLGVPLGVFLGYLATSFFVKIFSNWQYSFITQIVLLTPCVLSLMLFHSSELDVQMKEEEVINGKKIEQANIQNLQGRSSIHRLSIEPVLKLYKNHTYTSKLKELFTNKIFIFTMLTLASLYFVVTGIQFWISDYMRTILFVDQKTVYTAFSLISITAPIFGVLIGGIALEKVGGYAGKNAINLCLLNGVLASCCAIPIPFTNRYEVVLILLWFLFFFGGSLMPAVTGLMLHSIPKNYRAFGNSQAQLFHNLLGYLPAPVVYGIVNQMSQSVEKRSGMKVLMLWSLWGIIFLVFAKIEQQRLEKTQQDQEKEMLQYLQSQNQNTNKVKHHDQLSDKIPMSKITEKESEQSQSFLENNENQSPFDQAFEQKQQKEWHEQQQKADEEASRQSRPYAYQVNKKKEMEQPLINKDYRQSRSLGNEKNLLLKSNGPLGNSINFSQIKPQFYKYNQTPKQTMSINRKSSVAFQTIGMMLGRTSILYIDDPEDNDDDQILDNLQDEELKNLREDYNKEYDQYYKK
ncbi:MFS transporter (macronuclear) [Tetrahymena thermophila SB210]|uniref:MFS transporter n=1 Tax=Tetrahymena thermophila (strain SB210) TaxID=312017 RepID=I7MAB8_TETTS|nr:MFS transporter [Tetrahymena thermophila SB210]EAS04286.2 MFS transporter [Tetrahymena thermophila SB210]|eukprot:XP_001024531.2 MFS transporter [Tetrahymena thermophila SB210]